MEIIHTEVILFC